MSNDDDEAIDALVRAASARQTDDAGLAARVLTRLDQPRGLWAWLPSLGPGTALAGFACLMLVAMVTGYHLPNLADGEEAEILALAFGDQAPATFGVPIWPGADQ